VKPPVRFEGRCTNFVASGIAAIPHDDVRGDEQADGERDVEDVAVRAVEIAIAPGDVGEVEVGGEAGDGDGVEGGCGIGAGGGGE